MKHKLLIVILLIGLLVLSGCKDEDEGVEAADDEPEELEVIKEVEGEDGSKIQVLKEGSPADES